MNLSKFTNSSTACTNKVCCDQRAENLAILGVKTVLELCVGPSLRTLEESYSKHGIVCTGNDIDDRWRRHYEYGKWIIGDAVRIDNDTLSRFDAIVFAPPLSLGCSGERNDALSIDQILPSYHNFLSLPNMVTVLVLPGRSLATKQDREQFHGLLGQIKRKHDVIPLIHKVVKYYDLYIYGE